MRVVVFSDPQKAIESFPFLENVDVVVLDLVMPGLTGVDLLKEIRKHYKYKPAIVFVAGCIDRYDESTLMDMGAVALVPKPIDIDRLFTVIMEQFIENQHDRNRLLRVAERVPVKINEKFALTTKNIGYGGFFIPCIDVASNQWLSSMKIGQLVEFTYTLPTLGTTFKGKGEIVWIRLQPVKDFAPGFGLKFVELCEEGSRGIKDLVFLKRICSFIPAGALSLEQQRQTLGGNREYEE